MILPSKHISQERALLTVAGLILQTLKKPKTASATWEELPLRSDIAADSTTSLGYDSFVLALDFLYSIGAIEYENGLLTRRAI
jgi:hypothetical protein